MDRYYRTAENSSQQAHFDQATRAPGTTGVSTGTTGARTVGTTGIISGTTAYEFPQNQYRLAFAGTWLGTKSGTTERARYYRAVSSGTTGARKGVPNRAFFREWDGCGVHIWFVQNM
jgi:hypothetical protein